MSSRGAGRLMLRLYTCEAGRNEIAVDLSSVTLPPDLVWIDVLNGTASEVEFVERMTGLRVPTREELNEIESSSRLHTERSALYLSAPILFRSDNDDPTATPVGFVLTPTLLVTVRFDELTVFTKSAELVAKPDAVHRSSAGVFVALLEEIVDRLADVLERVGGELDAVSHRIFHDENFKTLPRRPAREASELRGILRNVGSNGDLASKIRDTLLSIGRIVPYVLSLAAKWLPSEIVPHLETLRQDIASLNDYDAHLTNKIQLLLDATLGLINIEQNNIIKVLTVVSVVGVPPTLIASMYGMNFRHMPELDWAWGYPYGLALIACSAILPLLWFKLRGWL